MHNSTRNAHPPLSKLTELLWTDPGLRSSIDVRELISALEEKLSGTRQSQRIHTNTSHKTDDRQERVMQSH